MTHPAVWFSKLNGSERVYNRIALNCTIGRCCSAAAAAAAAAATAAAIYEIEAAVEAAPAIFGRYQVTQWRQLLAAADAFRAGHYVQSRR